MTPQPAVLPDHLEGDQELEQTGVRHEVEALMAPLPQRLRDESRASEHLLEDRDDQDPGEEVRQIEDRLRHSPDPGPHEAVDEQREQDRHREEQRQLQQEDRQRVAQRRPEQPVVHHLLEPLEADPGALQDRLEGVVRDVRVVVLEGDDVACQRDVGEDQQQQHRRQGHQQQRPVTPQPVPQGYLRGHPYVFGGRPVLLGGRRRRGPLRAPVICAQ